MTVEELSDEEDDESREWDGQAKKKVALCKELSDLVTLVRVNHDSSCADITQSIQNRKSAWDGRVRGNQLAIECTSPILVRR